VSLALVRILPSSNPPYTTLAFEPPSALVRPTLTHTSRSSVPTRSFCNPAKMNPTERRTALDLEGHLDVEYCVFGKFSSGAEADKGVWDHAYVSVATMMTNLDEEVVEDALDAYDDLQSSWRHHDMLFARDSEES
jgi:hypothetical protein